MRCGYSWNKVHPKIYCGTLTQQDLTKILGNNYNPEMMRIEYPTEFQINEVVTDLSFKNESMNYTKEIFKNLPDLELLGLATTCDSYTEVDDLGPNVFPQYRLSVQCANSFCGFGYHKCNLIISKQKVLRRIGLSCLRANIVQETTALMKKSVEINNKNNIGTEKKEYLKISDHFWIWDWIDVGTGCECSIKWKQT